MRCAPGSRGRVSAHPRTGCRGRRARTGTRTAGPVQGGGQAEGSPEPAWEAVRAACRRRRREAQSVWRSRSEAVEPQGRAASWGIGVCSQGRAGPTGKRGPEEKGAVRRGEGGAEAARSRQGPQAPTGALGVAGEEGGLSLLPASLPGARFAPLPAQTQALPLPEHPAALPSQLSSGAPGPAGRTDGQEAGRAVGRVGFPQGFPSSRTHQCPWPG